MKTTTETIYTCEKCGNMFFFEDACRAHEQECDGVARGRRLANELTSVLKRIKFDENMDVQTPEGNSALEAVYDKETRKIVIISF
ncbi:MAG: hypothetical protein ACLSUT_03720 [Christensenellales bacterium]|jgi:hypothetical protein|nr:MAG TPA: C2H2 type zinc-finger protein [Caudoviricetes sp.]